MNTSQYRRITEVERYIHELAIALSGLPADEREDVIAGVRGHIDDALAGISDPGPADVQRILDDLGDPLTIASHAGAPTGGAQPHTAGSDRPAERVLPPLLQRDWVPMVVVGSFVSAILLFWLFPRGLVALPAILWLLGLVLLWASPLWRPLEKTVGTTVFAAGPAVFGGLGIVLGLWGRMRGPISSYLPELGVEPRRWLDPAGFVGGWLVLAMVLAAVVVTSAWLLRRGASRVPR